MAQLPPDASSASLADTLPLQHRLRVVAPSLTDVTLDAEDLAAPIREQVLRGKQLLLQLKELSFKDSETELRPTLASLRLALQALEAEQLTISQLDDIRAVLDVVTHQLNALSQAQRHAAARDARAAGLAEWILEAVTGNDWSLNPVRDLARHLQREHLHHAPPLAWYEASPQEPAAWAAAHGLNTAQVLLRMIGPEASSRQEIHNGVLAALLHDLGMAHLPAGVLAAQEAVTPEVKHQWRQHPSWAAERLAAMLKPEEADVEDAIAQHHERLDGTGYPHHFRGDAITPLARQLAVADCYAALCQTRPHRPPHSPRTATHLLLQEARAARLDDAAVLSLLPWGIAPPGTIVELSDGLLARVVAWGASQRTDFAPRPVLVPHTDSYPLAIIDLEQARARHLTRVLTSGEMSRAS
jgi:HD-GYP domain-containing protein (c-di-GMP phosphodiesterase class II)